MADRERRTESRPTIRVPAEPGIPAHAPDCARHVAFALDRITGGSGHWALLGAEGNPQPHPEDG